MGFFGRLSSHNFIIGIFRNISFSFERFIFAARYSLILSTIENSLYIFVYISVVHKYNFAFCV